MRKKVLIPLCLLLCACNQVDKPENTNYSEVFMEEHSKTALDVINQAYTDLNNIDSNELKDTLYQRSITLPVDLGTIPLLESIDQCEPITNQHSNAAFIGICPINDKYKAEIKIFDLNDNFWNSGEIRIQYNEIPTTASEFKSYESIITPLLTSKDDALNNLFGFTSSCLEENENSLSCLVIKGENEGQAYLDELKANASAIFSQEFLSDYDSILYNGNTAVWKVDKQGLHLTMLHDMLAPSLHYEPTTIGAVKEEDNRLIINCCVSYVGETVNDVHEISLIDEGNGYRLLSMQ